MLNDDEKVEPSHRRQLWPSTGEYPVYDSDLYNTLGHDVVRNEAFLRAVERHAPGSRVADLGTGAEANWALAAATAGAKYVAAVDELRLAYTGAEAAVNRAGMSGLIDVRLGSVNQVQSTGPFDLVISETIGSIASSEGLFHLASEARSRLLSPSGTFVPHRASTLAAPANLEEMLGHSELAFGFHASRYLEKIFDWNGSAFDVRLCVGRPDISGIYGEGAAVEDLKLNPTATWEHSPQIGVFNRSGTINGVALWVRFWTLRDAGLVDTLTMETSWGIAFIPLFDEDVSVERGEEYSIELKPSLSEGSHHPDFEVTVGLKKHGRTHSTYTYSSLYRNGDIRTARLYSRLFGRGALDAE